MAQADLRNASNRTPRYFSSTRPGVRPPIQGPIKTQLLAIEVPETQTPKHISPLQKVYGKPRLTPTAQTKQFPALTPKTKTQLKNKFSPTALSQIAPNLASSFSITSRAKPANSSPRAAVSAKSTPDNSMSYRNVNGQNSFLTHTKPGPGVKSVTPRVKRQVVISSERKKPSLQDLVTKVDSAVVSKDEKNPGSNLYYEHLFQTFQALRLIQLFPPVSQIDLAAHQLSLPRRPGYESKKTIIFDLDETLVHCCEEESQTPPDVFLQAGINIRPYVRECLAAANKNFEVIVFTASHQCYADVVLDYIDPDKTLVHHRLYRDHCMVVQGLYIKDLRVLKERDLKDIVIVDNAAYSFGYQLDNGIPIVSWNDDREDQELLNLIDYMQLLAAADDIRTVNRATFNLEGFYEDYLKELQSKIALKRGKVKRFRDRRS